MLDTPAPEAQPDLANSTDAAPRSKAPGCWPSPPFGSYPGPSEHHAPMACVVQGLTGRVARAQLISINFDERFAEVRTSTTNKTVALRFDQFLSLTLTESLSPSRPRSRPGSEQAAAVAEKRHRTPYSLLLKGANSMTGQTIGYVEKPARLFLFPPVDDADRVIRMFLPQEACLHRELGAPIGQMLVGQQAARSGRVERVPALQQELRR